MDTFEAVDRCLSYADDLLAKEEARLKKELEQVREQRKQNDAAKAAR